MKNVKDMRNAEIELVEKMIKIYCCKNHKSKNKLCDDCQQLVDYAKKRCELCHFMENKTFCSSCKVHCYKKDMREKIRNVMRFSGPRIMLYHPIIGVKHVLNTIKDKRK